MSKKPTYNSFEDLIKDKLDKFESNHGKDWSAISNKLDKIDAVNKNKKSRSNLFLALSLICAISLVTVWYYNENKPLNTVVKNDALTTNTEETPVEKPKKEDVADADNAEILTEPTLATEKTVNKKNNSGDQNQQVPLYRDDTSNIPNQDTTQNVTSIEPVLDSSTTDTTIGDSAINYNLTIISNKNQICYDDSILLYTDGCDSCNILWVVNGIDYGNNKELKIIGKEDISVSLFEITLKDSTYNSVLKDSTTITVNRAPEFEINYETTEDNGTISTYLTPIVVNDYSNGKYDIFQDGTFNWDFGDGTFETTTYPRHEYTVNGLFMAYLSFTDIYECTSYSNREIEITSNFDILAPNTFTPNGDGVNDIFMPEGIKISGLSFELLIFNKSGKVVYATKNINSGWNGFNQNTGQKCTNGNYLWVVKLENEDGSISQYQGSILLVD